MENVEWRMRNRECGMENVEWRMRNGEWGMGKRDEEWENKVRN